MINPATATLTDIRRIDRLYSCDDCGWWGHRDEAMGAGVFGIRCPKCRAPLRIMLTGLREHDTPSEAMQDELQARAKAKRLRKVKAWKGLRV